jgi:two-component system, OmpR family, catabolic regulation response regulator CreB
MTVDSLKSAGREALIVDDEPAILDLFEEILGDAGFTTTTFERGLPAIEAIKQRHFDLLLVDVGLPDISGMVICEQARERYGETAAILIITADSRTERLITALELGADDFVPKPFNVEELLARIKIKLQRRNEP